MRKLERTGLVAGLLVGLALVAVFVNATTTTVTTRGLPYVVALQSAATTGSGNIVDTKGAVAQGQIWITWSAGCGAGAVQIETSDDPTYAGTWAPFGSPITWTAASKKDIVNVPVAIGAVRARISTTVTGGTIDVTWQGY